MAPDILQLEPHDIFVSDHIGGDGFQFEEVTRQTDNYSADQNITSAFALIDGKKIKNALFFGRLALEWKRLSKMFKLLNCSIQTKHLSMRIWIISMYYRHSRVVSILGNEDDR